MFRDSSGIATLSQQVDYDPWGLELSGLGYRQGNAPNRLRFNGKEALSELGSGLLDFNWRFHDASIGRFFVVDRLSEKFSYMTPYQFASNDPVNRIELDGLEGIRHYEVYQNNGGENFIKTVVDVNVHVGLSKDGSGAK